MDNNKQNIGTIETIDIEKEMRTSFISYAMAVIINRALPDVRDGLKPVHRRILYSMSEMGMTNDKPYRKCARIVGEVLGKYHPHGDTAVYDSLVRMAQPFSTRYPLADGHGNFGSVDGDGAAAMRYTEARMSKIADELLSDIEKETVDFEPNFDETETQPTVLPSKIPNLLINGSGGIAVGMATNIPPHNLSEVADAAIALIENPDIALDGLMEYIKGPDFPTGGTIMGLSGIRSAYATGRGRVVVRAVAEIEEFGANRYRILVSELPYQVNKARLVEKIAEMVHEKRLDGISDLRDESDRNGMRIVIELKRDVNANVVLNNLYKHTQMQETFGVIMLALVDREPQVLSLKEMLRHYVDHRTDVVTRRTRYELDRAEARSHILEGLLIALDHIDEVIRIIRSSQEDGEAKTRLMEAFGLSDRQSQAILDMRLRRLTGLESERIQAEYNALQRTIARLQAILSDIGLVLSIIKEELTEMKQQYGDQRRTQIAMVEGEVDIEDLIQKEDMVVTLTRYGYIKRIAADTYRSQNRGGKGITGLTTREEDFVETVFITSTHTPILFFTNTGRVFTLKCYQLPLGGRTARGSAIVNLLRLEAGESIKTVLPLDTGDGGRYLVMATKEGIIKKTPASEFQNIRQNGLIALNLREEDALTSVFLTSGEDEILVGSRLGMAIRFHESDVRSMGRTATGVRSIRLKNGDEVLDVARLDKRYLLVITENGYGKMTLLDEYHRQTRGGQGVRTLHLTPKTGPVAGLKMVDGDEDLVLIDQDGTIIRTSASQVSVLSRSTQGVKVMRVGDDSRVAAIALTAPQEEFEDSDSPETSDPEE